MRHTIPKVRLCAYISCFRSLKNKIKQNASVFYVVIFAASDSDIIIVCFNAFWMHIVVSMPFTSPRVEKTRNMHEKRQISKRRGFPSAGQQ